ncbi:MAG: diaminopimelate dehydrogenase, partial [Oscillospiraceae bacterium]|nr:diaminopimelate dehydrogenase [Oscillospiraceae bacterium]
MNEKIRIGIVGYGNLGRGVESALTQNPDMELCAVFTRRDPASLKIASAGVPVLPLEQAEEWKDRIDVMILCGGSAKDLPEQGPVLARFFNTIDSFDTHPKIPAYFEALDEAAGQTGHVSILSVGWDPGLFSLNRLYAEAVLPQGSTYTFWGKGVSQGHSNAVRKVEGVQDAIQYTVPIESALEQVRSGSEPQLSTREKHFRECFVVAKEGADKAAIETAIK